MNEEEDHEMNKNQKLQKIIQNNRLSAIFVALSIGLFGMLDLPLQLYAKDTLNLNPAELAELTAFIMIPWIIKPLFGLLTDLYPCLGYRRKSYIYICSTLIFVMLLTMSFGNLTTKTAGIILLTLNIGLSFVMVVGEAIIVELSQFESHNQVKIQDNAKNYISLFFFYRYIGVLFSAVVKGYLVESIGVKNVFFVCSLFCFLTLSAGYILVEKKITPEEYEEFFRGGSLIKVNFDEDSKALNNLSVETIEKNRSQIIIPKNKSFLIKEFFSFIRQKFVIIPLVFMVLYIGTPSYTSPMFYFLSNKLHFSPSEFGMISFASTLLIILSIMVYRIHLKDYDFKIMITIATFASFTVTLFAYFLVLRLNLFWGISDFIMCLISNSILAGLGEIVLLPMLTLGCQLCPKYLEATVYSFFMSTLNLGGIISDLSGSYLTSLYGITSKNFQNLSKLVLIVNVLSILPLIILIFIPNHYFKPEDNESFILWDESYAKESILNLDEERMQNI